MSFLKALNGPPLFRPGGFAEANARVTEFFAKLPVLRYEACGDFV